MSFVRLLAILCLAAVTTDVLPQQTEQTLVRRTTLIVADIEASIEFYRDVLGYTRWYYHEGTVTEGSIPADAAVGDPSIFAIMKGRDPWIGMVGLLQKGPRVSIDWLPDDFKVAPGDTILMMETDDLDGIYQRMLDAGTPIWKHPRTTTVTGANGRQWDATFLFAFDPDGHLLEINQPHFENSATASIRRDYANVGDGQLHYRTSTNQATGIPLVLLHQSPLSGRMYRHLLPLLAKHRPVLAPDTPGYGESDRLPNEPGIEDYADALIQWLDALGVSEVDLFGYHTGSAIAVEMAARHPERIRSLVLMSVPLFSLSEMAAWNLAPLEFEEDGSHLLAMWNGTYSNRAPGQTLAMVAATVAEKQRAGENEWLALRALSKYPLEEQLELVGQPVSIIAAGDGLEEHSRKAAKLLGAREVVEKSDWGYGIFDTETAEIAQIIDSLLDQQNTDGAD